MHQKFSLMQLYRLFVYQKLSKQFHMPKKKILMKKKINLRIGDMNISALVGKPPSVFDLKIVYSYVIEVADSESDLGLHGRALVSEIVAFYHLLDNARGRPGRRGHVHLGHNFSIQILFQNFLTFFRLLGS